MAGAATRQRVHPDAAPDRPAERRAELAELPEADGGDDEERQVEPDALHHPAPGLPAAPGAEGHEGAALEERGEGEGERARAGGYRGHELGERRDPRSDREADLVERPGRVEDAERRHRDERRRDRDRDGEDERLQQRRRAELPRPGAAGAEEGGLPAPLLDEKAGGEDEGIPGQHGQLDGEHGHAHLRHHQRAAGGVERGAERGDDGDLRGGDRRPQTPLEPVELARDGLEAAGHHARRIREDAPRDAAAARVNDARIGGLVDDERAPRRVRGAHRAAADVAGHVPPVAVGHVLRSPRADDPRAGRGATRRGGSSAPARRRPRSRAPPRRRHGSRPAPRPSRRLPASHRRRGSRARAGRRRRRTWRAA